MSSPQVLRRYNPATDSSVDGHVFRGRLRGGDAGVVQAIHIMRQLVTGTAFPGREYANEGVFNPQIRALALSIVAGIDPRNKSGPANAVFQWVKGNIEFRGEVDELIQSPVKTIKVKAGDCDDHSTLLAALLMAIGFKVRFKTVAADKSQPQQFTHVYSEIYIPGMGWVPADTTVKQSSLGWQPTGVTREKNWGALGSLARSLDRGGLGDDAGSTLSQGTQDFLAIANSPTVAAAIDPIFQSFANVIQGTQSNPYQIPGQTVLGAGAFPVSFLYLGAAIVGVVLLSSSLGRRR